MSRVHGFICGPRLYEFQGWYFEIHAMAGPWPLKKDGDPRKRAGRKFWKMIEQFDALSNGQKSKLRVGGGCQQF